MAGEVRGLSDGSSPARPRSALLPQYERAKREALLHLGPPLRQPELADQAAQSRW